MVAGNHWELAANGESARHIQIVERTEAGTRVSGLTRSADLLLSLDERVPNALLAWNNDTERWVPFLRLDRKSWWFHASADVCDRYRVTRLADRRVVTGAGDFTAMAFGFELVAPANVRCEDQPFDTLMVAQNTGPVALVKAGHEALLQRAMIGDTVLYNMPMPTGLVVEQHEFINHPNTINCIAAPCPSNAVTAVAKFKLTVENAEAEVHVCEFRTAKQQNFELINQAGEVVQSWVNGRAFEQSPTQLTFAPGETKIFEGEVPLVDRNGVQLEGTYRVRASMFGHDQHAAPVESQIIVRRVRS
jgi:hypothetical protein